MPIVEEEMEIARIVEENQEEEEDFIGIRIVEEMISKRFYKYLKMFEKKKSERMPMRKNWDHVIDLKEGFVLEREEIYIHYQE